MQADREALSKKLIELRKRQSHLIELSKEWVQEGVFGKGFYHGDLHSGNIMISDEKATVIDFGNATTLTSDQQKQIIRMISAASVGDWEGFRSGYHALLPKDRENVYQQNRDALGKAFKEVFELGDFKYAGQRIGAALLRAQELGLQLPAAIQNFSQCQLRLQNSVNDINEQIRRIQINISKFDSIDVTHGDFNPELVLRKDADSESLYTVRIRREAQRIGIPSEEDYKEFAKLLDGTNDPELAQFQDQYMFDYKDMISMQEDVVFFKEFTNSILTVKDKKERDNLLTGPKKSDYVRAQGIIGKYNLKIDSYQFKRICEDPDTGTRDLEIAVSTLERKAGDAKAAGLSDSFQTLLEEYKTMKSNPDVKKEELEEKKKALFEEYKKVHEIYFTTNSIYIKPVELLSKMENYSWNYEKKTDHIALELKAYFEDKECKGDELKIAYDKYLEEVKRLEKEREDKVAELEGKAETYEEKRRIFVKREDSKECQELKEKFIAAYRESAALRFKKLAGFNEKYSHLNSLREPDNFLDVMGEVIMDNLKSAILKLGTYAVKYRKKLMEQTG